MGTLKDDILSDLDTFIDGDDFAVDVTFNSTTFSGIFDDAFEVVVDNVETTQPVVKVKDTDITGMVHGNNVTINSIVYNVTALRPDGTGLTLVLLSQD